jgi:hypothetical protein
MTEQTEKLLRYAQALAQETTKQESIVDLVPKFVQMNDYEKLNRMTQKPMVYMKF